MSVRKTILLFGGVLLIGQAIMLAFLLPQIAKAQIVADHLVISEIQTGLSGTGNSQKDFIEIYNPTDSDIDLDGYRLVKRTKSATTDTTIKSWTSTTIVPAKSFYLWVNSNYTDLANMADVTTTQSIADDNAIALRQGGEDTGTIIDAVAWGENASGLGGGANFPENIPDDQSLERIADTDDNSSDFVIQASPNPKGLVNNAPDDTTEQDEQTEEAKENDTEDNEEQSDEEEIGENDKDGEEETSPPPITGGQANIDASPPILAVFINELMPNPKGIDQGNEWVVPQMITL